MAYPSDRVKTRFLRDVYSRVALSQGVGQLEVEGAYSRIRTRLVEMLSEAPANDMTEVKALLEGLAPKAKEYLVSAPVTGLEECERLLSGATAALPENKDLLKLNWLRREDVKTFVQVIKHYRETCFNESYDPNDIISTDAILLSLLLVAE